MPVGLVIMKWDARGGTQTVAKYPEELQLGEKTQMQVVSAHEYSGQAGMISLLVGSLNIASYYTGPEQGFYVLLLLSLDEDPDTFEGGMADAARVVYKAYTEDTISQTLPSIFQRLSIFPTLNEEQLLAMTYDDEIKRIIINRLRGECAVSKSELEIWLKDKHLKGFVDLDAILVDLIKRDLIKEVSVKGMPSELIFLTNDILMTRIPAVKILKNPAEKWLPENLVNEYIELCKDFFRDYHPSEDDNVKILKTLIDPQAYKCLRLLRTGIATKSELEKLRTKGVDDIDNVLKILWENKMIHVFQGGAGKEHYALLSDFHLSLFFPKHLLKTVKSAYINKSKSDQVLLEYLNVLENNYLALKSKVKSRGQLPP